MNRKKLVSLCLVLALLVTAAVGATFAYFTDSDSATNEFTLGNVQIDLEEPAWEGPLEGVVPGVAYEKDPYVKNVGVNDAWIRVDVTVTDAREFNAIIGEGADLGEIFIGHNEGYWTLAGKVYNDADNTLTYQYYYYDVVKAGAKTERLFTAVKLPGSFDNADMEAIGGDFDIKVVAHAIQTSQDYATAADAFANYVAE